MGVDVGRNVYIKQPFPEKGIQISSFEWIKQLVALNQDN